MKKLFFTNVLIGLFSIMGAYAQCADSDADPVSGTFLQDQWTAYAYNLTPSNSSSNPDYNTLDYSNYRGYYLDGGYGVNNLSFDSRNNFGSSSSPSSALGYVGCSVSNNNHMVSYKRRGFPVGTYMFSVESDPSLNVSHGHDDAVRIFVNGIEVFSHLGCCDSHEDVWSGNLGPNSEVEYVWIERPGNSYGALKVEPVQPLPITYGQGEWYVSVYSDQTFTNFAGNYTRNTLDFDTTTDWGSNNSPSDANGYTGTAVNNNNHSFIYAREGFDCGIYQIDIPTYDDDVQLIINDVVVYEDDSWDNNNPTLDVWQGYLDADSRISFSIIENGGNSEGALDFTLLEGPGIDPTHFVWTGKIDNDMTKAGNWCPGLPNFNGSDSFYIPNNANNFPILDFNTDVNNLYIYEGANFTIADNIVISVEEDLSNFGIITTGENVEMNFSLDSGSGNQNISGNGFEIGKLSLENDVEISSTLNGQIRVDDQIVFNSAGQLVTNDKLTLACNFFDLSQRVAQIGDLSNGSSVIGNVTTEQCIPATRAFRFVSPPVTTTNNTGRSTIRENWQENAATWDDNPEPGYGTHITGTKGNADGYNGFDLTPSGNHSMYTFNNATQSWVAMDNTDTNTLVAGTPYRLMVRGDRDTDITSNASPSSNTILRAVGEITSGNVDYGSNFNAQAGAFNFVGNPYPAAVDMTAALNNSNTTNLSQDFYIWDVSLGGANGRGASAAIDKDTGTPVPVGSNGNQFLQPGQAAFVVTNTGGTQPQLRFQENFKNVNAAQTDIFRPSGATNLIPVLDISLYETEQYLLEGSVNDGVRIKFSQEYTTAASHEDLPKFGNIDENMAIVNSGQYLSIDRRDYPVQEETIPLFFNQYSVQEYSLVFSFNQLPETQLYVMDHYLEEETEVTHSDFVFNFMVDSNVEESMDPNRFELVFKGTLATQEVSQENWEVYPNPIVNNEINLMVPQTFGDNFQVEIINTLGQLVYTKSVKTNSSQAVKLTNLNFNSGVYFLQVTDSKNGKKLIKKLIQR